MNRHHRLRPSRLVASVVIAASALTVAGCGGNGEIEAVRSYTIRIETADDEDAYRYLAIDPVDIQVGDEVTFEMDNTGTLAHDLNVYGPDGELAGADAVAPGQTTQVTVLFDEAGTYQLRCYVDDHLTAHQMYAAFDVSEPAT